MAASEAILAPQSVGHQSVIYRLEKFMLWNIPERVFSAARVVVVVVGGFTQKPYPQTNAETISYCAIRIYSLHLKHLYTANDRGRTFCYHGTGSVVAVEGVRCAGGGRGERQD